MKTRELLSHAAEAFTARATQWIDAGIELLPNLVAAISILVVFWLLATLARSVIRRALRRWAQGSSARSLFSNLGFATVVLVGGFVALDVVGLEKTITSMLAGVGVVGLALGFAFQDLAANLLSGIMMSFRQPFRPGDVIETNGFLGTVQQIHLRTTVIRTFGGQIVQIPNRSIFSEPILNYTTTGKRRIEIPVGVSYGEDLENVEEITVEAVRKVGGIDENEDVRIFYREFGDSAVVFDVHFWIPYPMTSILDARHEAVVRIRRAFQSNDVTIPFPIRTLDFGIKGGRSLADEIPESGFQGSRSHGKNGGKPQESAENERQSSAVAGKSHNATDTEDGSSRS